MGPIRSSKTMVTGVIILVLLNIATTTLAAAVFANSTQVATRARDCYDFNLCASIRLGVGCTWRYDGCCCIVCSKCDIEVAVIDVGVCLPLKQVEYLQANANIIV